MRPLPPRDLPPVGIHRRALQITAVRHRDRHVLHLHQIFQPDLAGVFDDLRAALVAEILLDFLQFLDDQVAHNFFGAQNLQVLGDAPLNFGQLVEDLLLLHAGEALELQLDDGLRLPLAELERARSSDFARLARRLRAARISAMTSSRLSSAFWKPSKMCSRSRALRST